MRPWSRICVWLAVFVVFVGCRKPEGAPTATGEIPARPRVLVTNYPLMYFAERIAGGLVDVRFPMGPEGDPAFWQPDEQAIGQYQAADLILINGATYEKWMEVATLPENKILDTSAAFHDQFIKIENATTHSHGPEGEHSHAGTAFTTWLDFQQAAQHASAIQEALSKLRPQDAETFRQNTEGLLADLRQLDQEMDAVAKKIGDRPLFASHPVYDYWSRRYHLRLQSVHWEPDIVPTDEALAELQTLRAAHPAQVMIWEGTPERESVDKLKAIEIESLVFSPAGNISESGDWLAVMRANIAGLKAWADR